MAKWINSKDKKPEGEVFWGLTEGRDEQDICDWVIRRFWNDENGDYRTLDYSGSYSFPHSHNGQSWYNTIYAWLPLEEIIINDKDYAGL